MRINSGKSMVSLIQWGIVLCFFIHLPFAQAQVGTVTLAAGNGFGEPGSTGNSVAVSLDNPEDRTTGLQFDICRSPYLTLNICSNTARTPEISCNALDLGNGCDRVLFFSFGGDFIEVGTGPVLTLNYNVEPGAPQRVCHDLTLTNVIIPECEDDDAGGCGTGPAFENVTLENGEFCFSDSITTTTTTVPTTTTSITMSYSVSLSPLSAVIASGTSLQFSAKTTFNGEEVDGTYDWEIVSGSIIGSSIGENGLFMAGENTTDSDIEEAVKVTDTAHGNETATADVTIKTEKETSECEVTVNPSSVTVFSRDTLLLSVNTLGDSCMPGEYEWSIDTAIGSTVNQNGSYTAGTNDSGSQAEDVVTVVDRANAAISGMATITVESEGTGNTISVFPSTLLGFRWIPLPYLVVIRGENTNFRPNSIVSFEPGENIVELFHFGFGTLLFDVIILRADPQEGTVAVTVTTEEEVATGEVTIKLLSTPRAEDF